MLEGDPWNLSRMLKSFWKHAVAQRSLSSVAVLSVCPLTPRLLGVCGRKSRRVELRTLRCKVVNACFFSKLSGACHSEHSEESAFPDNSQADASLRSA